MSVIWLTAFLDYPADGHAEGLAFWQAVTAQVPSAARGDHGEFQTLLPVTGDDYLRVQRLQSGPAGVHLDLHVEDQERARNRANGLGATLLAEGEDYATFRSPAGFVFCTVSQPCSVRPGPARWGGHVSLVDEVCLRIAEDVYEREALFWARLLERRLTPSMVDRRFDVLPRPPGNALRLLLSRCPTGTPPKSHLDIATDDREAEVVRLLALGATSAEVAQHWTMMCAPGGMDFCVTDRSPVNDAFPGIAGRVSERARIVRRARQRLRS